jgi:hypothetical protein
VVLGSVEVVSCDVEPEGGMFGVYKSCFDGC